MRQFSKYAHADGSITLKLGDDSITFTAEEWDRHRIHVGTTVAVTEKRPLFSLFPTRTQIRWIKYSEPEKP